MADPVGVTGCITWCDVSDSSTLYDATVGGSPVAANGAVARLANKANSSHDLSNSTVGERPLRKTGIQNGRDCLLFDGTDDKLFASQDFPETGNAEFSVFVVSKKLTSTKGTLLGWGTAFVALGGSGLYDDGTSTTWGYAGNNPFYVTSPGTANFHLHSYLKSAGAINSTSTFRRDRVSVATSGHSISTPNILALPLVLGQYANFSPITYHGYVGELLIYDSKLSDSDRDLVESYLYDKWFVANKNFDEGGMFGGMSGAMTGGMAS